MTDDRIEVPIEEERRILAALIQAAIAPDARFAYFLTTGEGRHFPGSTMEETSGFVITEQGRIFSFWFGPDEKTGHPSLTRWVAEPAEDWWATAPEYLRARAKVGLT